MQQSVSATDIHFICLPRAAAACSSSSSQHHLLLLAGNPTMCLHSCPPLHLLHLPRAAAAYCSSSSQQTLLCFTSAATASCSCHPSPFLLSQTRNPVQSRQCLPCCLLFHQPYTLSTLPSTFLKPCSHHLPCKHTRTLTITGHHSLCLHLL